MAHGAFGSSGLVTGGGMTVCVNVTGCGMTVCVSVTGGFY